MVTSNTTLWLWINMKHVILYTVQRIGIQIHYHQCPQLQTFLWESEAASVSNNRENSSGFRKSILAQTMFVISPTVALSSVYMHKYKTLICLCMFVFHQWMIYQDCQDWATIHCLHAHYSILGLVIQCILHTTMDKAKWIQPFCITSPKIISCFIYVSLDNDVSSSLHCLTLPLPSHEVGWNS